MTSAKQKIERRTRAITEAAGLALRDNNETEFSKRWPECDVHIQVEWVNPQNGDVFLSDLFTCACVGSLKRKKDDLAKFVAERMLKEGVDLGSHISSKRGGWTPLMVAAGTCGSELVSFLLPHSNIVANTTDREKAAEFADAYSGNRDR